jgi:hypothetical protein
MPIRRRRLRVAKPWLQVSFSRHLTSWMATHRVSHACTTYQTGKLLLFGRNPDGNLSIFERTFNRCMGLWASEYGRTLWMSSLCQLWRFEDVLQPGETHEGYDHFYVPRLGTAENQAIHDIVVATSGRVVFVATGFGYLATISDKASCSPVWQPEFISRLTAEDRCHLNGVALENGKCRYATAVSTTDVFESWRDRQVDGGMVLELPTSRVVGMSMPRNDKTFSGLALDEELSRRGTESRCGLAVIDLRTGEVAHWLQLEGPVPSSMMSPRRDSAEGVGFRVERDPTDDFPGRIGIFVRRCDSPHLTPRGAEHRGTAARSRESCREFK